MTVAPVLACWKPAVQAPWAASCALEPAPLRVPLSLLPLEALDVSELVSLPAPQAERLRPRARAAAVGTTARRKEVRFTSVS